MGAGGSGVWVREGLRGARGVQGSLGERLRLCVVSQSCNHVVFSSVWTTVSKIAC